MLKIFRGNIDLKETRVPKIRHVVIYQRQYNQLPLLGYYYTIAIFPSYSFNYTIALYFLLHICYTIISYEEECGRWMENKLIISFFISSKTISYKHENMMLVLIKI